MRSIVGGDVDLLAADIVGESGLQGAEFLLVAPGDAHHPTLGGEALGHCQSDAGGGSHYHYFIHNQGVRC